MVAAGVRQGVDLIQLPADEGLCGDVLHEVLLALLLDDDIAADDVLIVHLDAAGFRISHLIGGDLPEARALHIPLGRWSKSVR